MCTTTKEAQTNKGSRHMITSSTPKQSNKSFAAAGDSTAMSLKADGTSVSKAITQDQTGEGAKSDGRASATPASATKSGKANKLPPSSNETREPHDNDVLCGRGGSINTHPGNENFRQLVERRKRVYLTARFKREKRLIACSIVSEIRNQDPPGRFLSRDAKTGIWFDIGDEKARDKTSQALRENAPTIRAEMETENNKVRAEMKRAEEEEAARAAEAHHNHHHHPQGGPSMHWSYHSRHHHDSYEPGPEYPDEYHDDYDRRWSSSPAEGHHHPKAIRMGGSGPPQRRVGPHGPYRGSHPGEPHAQPHSFHPNEESPEERKSAFGIPKIVGSVPSSFAAFAKSSLPSFSGQAPSPGGGPSDHPMSLDESGRSEPLSYRHYPPGYGRDAEGRRSVHFESSGDVRRRRALSRRHPSYHRSHSYEDLSTVKPWDHEYRGRERYNGEPDRRRSSGRYHGEHPGYRHEQSLEQRERQRVSFSPPPVSRRSTLSPLRDEMMNQSWDQNPQHAPSPSAYDHRHLHSPHRPDDRHHQRPLSPYTANYYDRHASRTPIAGSRSQPASPTPYLNQESRGYSPTPPPMGGSSMGPLRYYDLSKGEYVSEPLVGEPQNPPPRSKEDDVTVGTDSDFRDQTNPSTLITQVANHILTSWDSGTDVPEMPSSATTAPTTQSMEPAKANAKQEEGQEVELVEMEEDDPPTPVPSNLEDEARMPPPEERRAVEIDWASKAGGCHTWISESLTAASFFTGRSGGGGASSVGSPVSPTNSIEMDGISLCGTEVYSCAGSVGGGSLCQVFDKESLAAGSTQNALMDTLSQGGGSIGGASRASSVHSAARSLLRQMPSWERSFRSRSPSPFEMEEKLATKRSTDLGDAPLPSLTYSKDPDNDVSLNVDSEKMQE